MSKFKETEFGVVPVDWDVKTILELKANEKSAIAMGPFGSNIKAENFVPEGVPVIRGTNLNYDKYVDGEFVFLTEEKADELKGSNCAAGDLVFTHRGTIGQVALIPKGKYPKYVISQSGMKLTVDKSKINNEFLFYFFKSKYGQYQLLKNEGQVGVPSLSNPLTTLKLIEVPVPSLKEQVQIAETLSSIDEKISLLERQNICLESLAEVLFKQWFVNGANSDWRTCKISDVAEINLLSIGKEYKYSTIEYLDTGSITEGVIDSFETYSLETAPSRAQRIVHENDIVYSLVRPIQRHYGLLQGIKPNTIVSTGFCVISCKTINPFFIYLLLTQDEMVEYFDMVAEGSTSAYPSLRPSDIAEFEFKVPPKNRLDAFAEFSVNAWSKMRSNTSQIHSLKQTRNVLLPKLVSGELRIIT